MGKIQTVVIALLLLIVLTCSTIQVIPTYLKMKEAKREVAEKTAQLERIRAEVHSYQQDIHDLEHKPSATEKIAREKFNYCRDTETIILYTE